VFYNGKNSDPPNGGDPEFSMGAYVGVVRSHALPMNTRNSRALGC